LNYSFILNAFARRQQKLKHTCYSGRTAALIKLSYGLENSASAACSSFHHNATVSNVTFGLSEYPDNGHSCSTCSF